MSIIITNILNTEEVNMENAIAKNHTDKFLLFKLINLLLIALVLSACAGSDDGNANGNTNDTIVDGISPGTPVSRNIIITGLSDGLNENEHAFKPTITGQYSVLLTSEDTATSCIYIITPKGKATKMGGFSPRRCHNYEDVTNLPLIAGEEYVFKFSSTDATSYEANLLVVSEGTSQSLVSLSPGTYDTVVGTLQLVSDSSFYRLQLPTNADVTIFDFPCGGSYTLWLESYDFNNYNGNNFIGKSSDTGACSQTLPVEASKDYLIKVTNNSPSKKFSRPAPLGIKFKIRVDL